MTSQAPAMSHERNLTCTYDLGLTPGIAEGKVPLMVKLSRKGEVSRHRLKVGELAAATGKTVRAIHLYEELGLLRPVGRTEGRFRLYEEDAIARIHWISKLQAIGFTLAEIQGFVREFEHSASGRDAATRVREVFARKRAEIDQQMLQLQAIASDLENALAYLDACDPCSTSYAPKECAVCGHQGHEAGHAPHLFAGLSSTAAEHIDVGIDRLRRGGDLE
ncbi:MAG TPA: MerR family transcriptional regulator [Kofleriaceae bacterium]|nr:MerR family transcriptional regulator [Kofleriaceae bacterium]